MIVENIIVGMLQVNCYVLGCEETGEGVVIDPGDFGSRIVDLIRRLELKIVAIPNTHAHFDHVLAVNEVRTATGAPFWLHSADEPVLARRCQAHCVVVVHRPPGTGGRQGTGVN